ncbi:FAD-dependent oxidoreductase [Chlorogloeopsis fritschii PCC 9212]|uniref:FAD-dependent oxidoreductase n=1 Tax=Chlorogloeopsis fritschii TaxID=1124 RepID=UPI00370D9E1F
MMNQTYTVDVLVVGGGTGGTAAAIQAARRGAKTILVSEFPWLGGMLTSAGVSAPDGNELEAFQTGLWGEFLRELQQRQLGGLDNSWVSFFSYDPRVGGEIFADWVQELPNLNWISGQVPRSVFQEGNCITGVEFQDFTVQAKVILDATELGDLLALAEIPYRWGWELQSEWGEPSAPVSLNALTAKYPVQAPTWVVLLQDYGEVVAPEIQVAPNYDPSRFAGAWDNYGAEAFLNYGRLPGGLFMINWPICGNDYGEGVARLIESETARGEFGTECLYHSQNFAYFIQSQLGRRFGLANNVFPQIPNQTGAFALHPYYRESRRLVGLTTVTEQDILPITGARVAALKEDAIAIGNYANDHHYPGIKFELQPKSIRWGGRLTGTPFTIPYRCLIPVETDGLLVCEKNISVSHIANGATRLQPVVMGIGQAAGMAAALCIELNCQPRDLPVRVLQEALLRDWRSPAAIIPLFNLSPLHPNWLYWQLHYLDNPETYPVSGNCPDSLPAQYFQEKYSNCFSGILHKLAPQEYRFTITVPAPYQGQTWQLVTLRSHVDEQLQSSLYNQQTLKLWGRLNYAGNWLLVEYIDS